MKSSRYVVPTMFDTEKRFGILYFPLYPVGSNLSFYYRRVAARASNCTAQFFALSSGIIRGPFGKSLDRIREKRRHRKSIIVLRQYSIHIVKFLPFMWPRLREPSVFRYRKEHISRYVAQAGFYYVPFAPIYNFFFRYFFPRDLDVCTRIIHRILRKIIDKLWYNIEV